MAAKIVFMGAGAVGSYVGGHLALAGENVTLVDPWPEHIEKIRRDGLVIESTQGEKLARPPTLHLHEAQSLAREPADIAFLCVKSYDTVWAAELIRQYLAPGGFIVSLQNCVNEERIAGVAGWGSVLGCIASSIMVNTYKAGHVRRTVQPGGKEHVVFRAGEVHGRLTPRLNEVVRLMSLVDSAKATANLWGERWTKLVQNAMGNGISAVTGLGGRELVESAEARLLSTRLAGEAVAVGQALGFQLEPIHGIEADAYRRAARGEREALEAVDAAARRSAARTTPDGLPSTAQDIAKGRRTEIDFMNGLVAEKGDAAGVPTPTHKALVEVVRRVERKQWAPDPQHLRRVLDLSGIPLPAGPQPALQGA